MAQAHPGSIRQVRPLRLGTGVKDAIRYAFGQLWLPFLLCTVLVLLGFTWGLPNALRGYSFQTDETAAVEAVTRMKAPALDPGFYPWGTAVFYQVYFVRNVTRFVAPLQENTVYIIGRLIVWLSALGALGFLFLLGRKLFDERTGRWAALLLAVVPGFVIPAHYFKMDVPMIFWVLAALVVAYELMDSARLVYVVALGLLVGYSIAVKYTAIPLLPAAAVAMALVYRRLDKRAWVLFPATVGLGFLIGEPRLFLNWREVMDAIASLQRDAAGGAPYVEARPPAWWDYPVNVLPYALGLPLFALSLPGLVWGIWKLGRKWLPIWTFVGLSYFLLAQDNLRFMRYVLPVVPFLVLLIAAWVLHLGSGARVRFAGAALAVALLYTAVFSLSYVQVMLRPDPRDEASGWLLQNVPRGEPVGSLGGHYANLPDFPKLGYPPVVADYNIARVESSALRFIVTSEVGTRPREEALAFHPEQQAFLEYLKINFVEVARFENSQELLGINSKAGAALPQDWLIANPRITILEKRSP